MAESAFLEKAGGQPACTLIFFSTFFASAVFASIAFNTPFLKRASILSESTPSGNRKLRSNLP